MVDSVTDVIINYKSENLDQTVGGIKQTSVALDGLVVASSSTEKSLASLENKFASLERKYGTSAATATQFAKEQNTLNLAVANNPALKDRSDEVLAAMSLRYGQTLKGTAAAANELGAAHNTLSTQGQALAHAFRTGFEELALGVPITQVATQQFSHLTYAATGPGGLVGAFQSVSGILGGAATSAAAFVSPAIAAAGAMGTLSTVAVAAGVHWASAQTTVVDALRGIGRQSGVTVSDINNIAESTAQTTKASIGQAREFATAFAETGKIGRDNVEAATKATDSFAKSLGVDGAAAAKLFAAALADPAKGLEELEAKTGAYDLKTQELVQSLVRQGEAEQARAILIKGVADATKDAAEANGFWAASFKAVKNGFDLVGQDVVKGFELARHDLGGPVPSTGVSKQEQLATAQGDLNKQLSIPASSFNLDSQTTQAYYDSLAKLVEQVEKLKKAVASDELAAFNARLKESATAADNAANAYVPQIQKIKETEDAIHALIKAQQDSGVRGAQAAGEGDDAALVAAQNQLKILQESKAEAAVYNNNVRAIAASYQGVSTAAALQLSSLQQQLSVAQEVTAEAKMRAQYSLDFNTEMLKTGNELQAQELAAGRLAISQANATASVLKQAESLQDQSQMIRAHTAGTEASMAASIAYKNAIQSGADSTAAAAVSAATLSVGLANAAASAQRMADAEQNAIDSAARAANAAGMVVGGDSGSYKSNSGTFKPDVMNGGAGSFVGDPSLRVSYAGGGLGKQLSLYTGPYSTPSLQDNVDRFVGQGNYAGALAQAQSFPNLSGGLGGGFSSNVSDKISITDTLTQLRNSQTDDKGVQRANLQSELAWLQSLPESIARDQKIVEVNNSMKQLIQATDANTAATAATLNPLYSQGHGALAIGYYKAASGLDMVAQGPTSGDQIPFHAMINGGERVQITPSGQQGSNDNTSVVSRQVVNNNTFVFNGNQSNSRRSMRQTSQGFGQIAAAMS